MGFRIKCFIRISAILFIATWALYSMDPPPCLAQVSQPTDSHSQGTASLLLLETEHDFGIAHEGNIVSHDFIVRNTGQGELEIRHVSPDCGCTVANFDHAILPGGEGKITLRLDLKGYNGKVKKITTVISNDPQKPKATLTMQGNVKKAIDVRPGYTISFRGMADQIKEQSIDIETVTQPFRIREVEENLGGRISHRIETVEEGRRYRLRVMNRLQKGEYNGFVKLITDHPLRSEILVRVRAVIEGEISVRPSEVILGRLTPRDAVRSAEVQLVNNRRKPFQITKLTFDNGLIDIRTTPLAAQSGFSLEITPKMGAVAQGARKETTLSIETDAMEDERHNVRIQLFNISGP